MDGTGGRPPEHTLRRSVDSGLDLDSTVREGGVTEIHARAGDSGPDADSVIESLLDHESRAGRARQAIVVSSDRRVRAAAAGARARVVSSEEFLEALAHDLRKRASRRTEAHGGRPDFATDEGLDAGRTMYWLRELGIVPTPDEATGQDCAPTVNPDDVDMGEILRRHDAKKRARSDQQKRPRRP